MTVKSGWANKLVKGEHEVPHNKEAMEWLNQQRNKIVVLTTQP